MLAGVLLCSICGHVRVRSNQALPSRKQRDAKNAQADGMSWVQFTLRAEVLVLNNKLNNMAA